MMQRWMQLQLFTIFRAFSSLSPAFEDQVTSQASRNAGTLVFHWQCVTQYELLRKFQKDLVLKMLESNRSQSQKPSNM